MSPALGAAVAGAVAAGYVPILRGQVLDGEVGIPFGSINPIRVRRDDHPLAFRLASAIITLLIALVLIGCVAVLVRSASA